MSMLSMIPTIRRHRPSPIAVLLALAALLLAPMTPLSAAAGDPPLCDPVTQRFTTTSSDIGVPQDPQRARKAMQWLRSMMDPPQDLGGGAGIRLSGGHGYRDSGEVSGSFTLDNPGQYPVVSTELSLDGHASIPSDYRGQVSGTAPAGVKGVVKAYLHTDRAYEQASVVPAVVQPDGRWELDLSPVDPGRAGEWQFQLHDAATGEQIGGSWPEHRENLRIELYSLTESGRALVGMPAPSGPSFTLSTRHEGLKLVRLVDTRDGTILAEYHEAATADLIRSNSHAPGQVGYGDRRYTSDTYDQALALIVAVGADDRSMADRLVNGLRSLQTTSGQDAGAFPRDASQLLNPETSTPLEVTRTYFTGRQAFILYALLRYQERYGDINGVSGMVRSGLGWVAGQRSTTGAEAGLYKGGRAPDQITWHSTEHNTDLWHVFELASRVLGEKGYRDQADALARAIMDRLWNAGEQRFNRGWNASGPDTADPLDSASWGSVFLHAIGEHEKARAALGHTRRLLHEEGPVRGYTARIEPGLDRNIWFEGTFGVTHAQVTAGLWDEARISAEGASPAQAADGSWPYTLRDDPVEEVTSAGSMASTAWYLLATSTPQAMWSECRVPGAGAP